MFRYPILNHSVLYPYMYIRYFENASRNTSHSPHSEHVTRKLVVHVWQIWKLDKNYYNKPTCMFMLQCLMQLVLE